MSQPSWSTPSHGYTDEDMADLRGELNTLTFDDLEHSIPLQAEMLNGDDGDLYNEYEPKPENPLSHTELRMLRKFMRRHSELIFDDTADKLIAKHHPELITNKSIKGLALRQVKEKEMMPTSSLNEDTFSFIISAPIYSTPMLLGVVILLLKVR